MSSPMKKAPIAVALVLVFGLFAAAFSLAPAIAQNATNTTGLGNATTTGNETGTGNLTDTGNATETNVTQTEGATFSASGSIASLIFDTGETTTISETANETGVTTGNMTTGNETATAGNMTAGNMTTGNETMTGNDTTLTMPQVMTGDNATSNMTGTTDTNLTSTTNMTSSNATTTTATNETTTAAEDLEVPYVLSGDWSLDVQDGTVNEFTATFTMVHIDGTGRHTHELSNFASSDMTSVNMGDDGTAFIFGTADVAVNGTQTWTGADTLIVIENHNVVSISLATEDTDDHFKGQPIYGIVDSFTDENGNELIQTDTATAGNATTTGNATTGGNATAGNATTGNETGSFFDNATGGLEDFFDGTGQ